MADAPNFAKLVPGFDFLQTLVKNAGSALPNMGQWVAPTLNPDELEKRIDELRTVQFWLEQNARMLGTTIQALEVQRMTLSTLRTMNVQMEDLRDSLTIRLPGSAPKKTVAAPPPPAAAAASAPAAAPTPATAAKSRADDGPEGESAAKPTAPAAGIVDPMQWWGALTKQFTELAAGAMKDTATDAAKAFASSMVKPSFDAAGQKSKKTAGAAPAKTARKAAAGAATGGSTRPRRRKPAE